MFSVVVFYSLLLQNLSVVFDLMFLKVEQNLPDWPYGSMYIYGVNIWISCIRTADWNELVWSSQFLALLRQ